MNGHKVKLLRKVGAWLYSQQPPTIPFTKFFRRFKKRATRTTGVAEGLTKVYEAEQRAKKGKI